MMEKTEKELTDLETREANVRSKLSGVRGESWSSWASSTSASATNITNSPSTLHPPYSCKHLAIVLKTDDFRCLERALHWLRGHGPVCCAENTRITIVYPQDEQSATSATPQVPNSRFLAFPRLQYTRSCVDLIQGKSSQSHDAFDLLAICNCSRLSKHEYEATDYTPLLEKILLKEAIQPVILLK